MAAALRASISGAGSVEYYGDPEVKQSVSGVGQVVVGGETRRVSILFTDVKDFTPIAGKTTTRGSRVFADWVPDSNPVIVERLIGVGLVVWKTQIGGAHGAIAARRRRRPGAARSCRSCATRSHRSPGAAASVARGARPALNVAELTLEDDAGLADRGIVLHLPLAAGEHGSH